LEQRGHSGSNSSMRFISDQLQHIVHSGHFDQSARTICLPEAKQKGKLRLQLGQSSLCSGISNLQKGQGANSSGSSSVLTGRLAIPSILVLNFGGIWSMFSGLISTQA